MATQCGRSDSQTEQEADISIQQQSLIEIKQWIETEAGFHGRSDEDFLHLFLQSREFEVKQTKEALIRYYKSRRDFPQWWANRNVNDEITFSMLKYKPIIALKERDIDQPSVIIAQYSRYLKTLNNMDDYTRLLVITFEKVMRRNSSKRNGMVWIVDCKDYKGWIIWYFMNPFYIKTFTEGVLQAIPMKLKSMIAINAPFLAVSAVNHFSSFLPQSVKERVHVYGSDWASKISEHLPLEVLPEEYGGQAGPMEHHENAFVEEVLAFNDYIVDDSKYGFP